MVDDDVYEWAMQWKWGRQAHGRGRAGGGRPYYAYRQTLKSEGERRGVLLHREIARRAGMDIEGKEVDHRDGNGLNNLTWNLRPATRCQNSRNIGRSPVVNTSGVKGVWYDKRRAKWVAELQQGGAKKLYKSYGSRDAAVTARREAERRFQGSFARPEIAELSGNDFASFTLPSGRLLLTL